jgi:hypothetical protein
MMLYKTVEFTFPILVQFGNEDAQFFPQIMLMVLRI